MKSFCLYLFLALILVPCAGCMGGVNTSKLLGASTSLVKSATVSDQELMSASAQLRARGDRTNKVAGPNSPYTKRLHKLMAKLQNVNGIPLNYKVYISQSVNADSTPDGSIRVMSALMDRMNDDELRFVIGHEIGHIAHGHSKKRMQSAYLIAAGRQAAGAFSKDAGMISDSALGSIAEEFLKAQYSQSNELEADEYGLKFLKDNGYNLNAAITCMAKLGGSGGFFSSHPSSEKRIKNLHDTIKKYSH